MQKTKERLNKILSERTGRTIEEIEQATDRNNWMDALQAKEFGLIDDVIEKRK